MKTFIQIILRYALSAVGVLMLLIFFNSAAFLSYGYKTITASAIPLEYNIREFADSLTETETGWMMPQEQLDMLHDTYTWAMLLDADGMIVWSDRLPENLMHRYTSAEVASFTRWYLDGYPVYAYTVASDHLLVIANPQNSRWKYTIEMKLDSMNYFLQNLPAWIVANLILAAALILLCSVRFFWSLRCVANGLADLAKQRPVKIPEKGLFGSLYHDLNQTSKQLRQQQEVINQRDRMRTEWIAGVSHDVRTPLTLILGNAAQIAEDPLLAPEVRKKSQIIQTQCQRLRKLIENLNLTSKLAYHAQSIRKTSFCLAALLRKTAADLLNQNPSFNLTLQVPPSCEGIQVCGDVALLDRAICNLLNNSMQYAEPTGEVSVILTRLGNSLKLVVSDHGPGYPKSVLERLRQPLQQELPSHGLGLFIVRQIVALHGGITDFKNTQYGTSATIILPIEAPMR